MNLNVPNVFDARLFTTEIGHEFECPLNVFNARKNYVSWGFHPPPPPQHQLIQTWRDLFSLVREVGEIHVRRWVGLRV